jgi:hypothetical protein
MQEPPLNRIRWGNSYRIIPSRFPPIDLFERVSPPEDWEAICALEGLTNPRLREDAGQISFVPVNRRISGKGSSYVMAAFTHLRKSGSRFSDGTFGIYYAAKDLTTAHIETISRMERFYASTEEDRLSNDFRTLIGKISASFHDIRGDDTKWEKYYKLDNWEVSRKLGKHLRGKESNGILYNSVRHAGGECVGVFWPDIIEIPKQAQHFQYHWNGQKIDKYYDFEKKEWFEI